MGPASRGTIFEKVVPLTATACGVSPSTVTRLGKPRDFVHDLIPRQEQRKRVTLKSQREAVLMKYGERWGAVIRHVIHGKFKEEQSLTRDELMEEMKTLYPEFQMSRTTLYHLLRALGFSYRLNNGRRYIFERPDLIRRRATYLSEIDSARDRGECVVYMDETWVYDGMVQKRGWNDNCIPAFPSDSMIAEYSCGRTAGKNKGKRGIVIGAITENGVIPQCTEVIISGYRDSNDDYHRDMDADVFEEWLQTSIPYMKDFANGRHVTIVMDNAPYHSRALHKVRRRTLQWMSTVQSDLCEKWCREVKREEEAAKEKERQDMARRVVANERIVRRSSSTSESESTVDTLVWDDDNPPSLDSDSPMQLDSD
ncbi:hypothetical protein OESDEN_07061 [Oesophagostomum dentatum]|uniref:Tc1-like transposase DDE domain-containing protein n=1 Tax=Oesophagostomum dentatum TaxID=61180 RepID=A0A0B1TB59_OESDE|nr:hypothetical protein OESDEN_07061 [Oesophagostomum dentatum]